MDMIYLIMQQTFVYMIPLLIVALGGMFSERSGIVNIALEGKMLLGAFVSIFFIGQVQASGVNINAQVLLLAALVVAALTGAVAAFFHAYASISLNANQIISGVAINMFAPAFAIYVARIFGETQQVFFDPVFSIDVVPALGHIPVLDRSFSRGHI